MNPILYAIPIFMATVVLEAVLAWRLRGNRIADAAAKGGSRLVGDVDFAAVAEVAGAVSPVPGGVGPLTVAMLLANTLLAAELRMGQGPR